MSNNIEYASVSTIIPCYKSTETLERAVVSVWNQTLRPKELILVDDGSPDDGATVALMHELQNKYGKDWITIIDLGADLGVSTARNSGWEKVKRTWVEQYKTFELFKKIYKNSSILFEQACLEIESK